mgnify:FL=1
MAKHIYQQSVFSADESVSVAPYASVVVTLAGGGAAVIWSDSAGTTVIDDSTIDADMYGFFSFYADSGKYDIAITTGSITKTLHNVAIGTGDRGTFATYADVDVTGTAPGFVIVLADETNDGARTTYLDVGADLQWLPLVEA